MLDAPLRAALAAHPPDDPARLDLHGRVRPGRSRACSTDGRPRRTGRYADDFRRLYPQVDLDENVLFVDDGDVLTSAGLAAGIDLCLHIMRRDHGAEVANAVARHCVVPPWRDGGQAQYIDRPVPGRRR